MDVILQTVALDRALGRLCGTWLPSKDVNVMTRLTGIIALSLAAGGLFACGGGEHAPGQGAGTNRRHRGACGDVDAAERLEAGGIVAAQESAWCRVESSRRLSAFR